MMNSLDQGEPQTTRLLSQKLGLHQSSVSRTLKEMMEEGLAIKKGKSYSLSNMGIIQKNTQEWMGRTLRCLAERRDFIQSHDLTGIPPGFQAMMGVVCDGREAIEIDPAMPNHIQEIIVSLLAPSRDFLVASSILIPDHQLAVARAVKEGGSLQAVTSDRIIQELRLKSLALRDDSVRSRIGLYRHNNTNLHLMVTESTSSYPCPGRPGRRICKTS